MDHQEEFLRDLERAYIELMQPKKLITHFQTDEEFKSWLQMGDKEGLRWTLKAFENEELYRHCQMIKEEMSKYE